jgi:POT family proton-dependent oligopeptide transporter
LIGPQRAVLYGGILIASGHFSMAVPSLTTFYFGLFLIVIGTGLLKGNVSVIVGRLHSADDARRDAGFSIFYMGINTGAFIAPLICGYLGQRVDWHLGFAAAGVGMAIGIIQYVAGLKYLGDAGRYPAALGSAESIAHRRRNAMRWTSVTAAVLVVFGLGAYSGLVPITAAQVADIAGYLLLALIVAFLGWLFFSPGWTAAERRRLYAIAVLFLAATLFWSEFEQAGTTLNLFADRNTRNSIAGYVLAVGAILAERGVMVSPLWLAVVYFLHTCGELSLSPVGMSAMSKLAPVRIGGLIMGFWFLALSAGNYVGGRIAGLYEAWTLPNLFGAVAAFGIGAAVVMFLIARPVNRLEQAER